MNKATFLKKIKETAKFHGNGSNCVYSKLGAIKFMRDITRESGIGLKECKETFDSVCSVNEELDDKHFEPIYKKIKQYVRNFEKGISKTTVVKHLYKCAACYGGNFHRNGEIIKADCQRIGGCVGKIIGEEVTVTTIRRFPVVAKPDSEGTVLTEDNKILQ